MLELNNQIQIQKIEEEKEAAKDTADSKLRAIYSELAAEELLTA